VECARCGVIFAKFEPRGAVSPGPPREGVERAQDDTVQRDPAADAISGVVRAARVLVLVVLVAWTWQFARAPMGAEEMASFIHLPNLVFHEAGHVIFSIFGRFATVLGGSLLQFLVPLILAGAFLRQRDPFGAVVCTWWAGQNLLDLAPYIADARALQLVLLGGKTGAEVEGHDWEFLLTEMGWLHLDRTLGLWTHRIGLTIMTAALAWGLVYLAREWRGSPARTLPGRAFE
jgi:hypothetical protein